MKIEESLFFNPFFARLNLLGIEYAVMRNGKALPITLDGSDLDIIVSKESMDLVYQVILDVANECGGGVISQIKGPAFKELSIMGYIGGAWWGVTIDLCGGGYLWEPIDYREVLGYREKNTNGIWCLSDKCAHLLGCAKELTMNRVLPARYHKLAKMAISDGLTTVFSSAFFCKFVSDSVLSGEKPSCGEWLIMRFRVILESLIRKPISSLYAVGYFYWSKIYRIIRPCGKMMAILGTDGSGKSTIIHEIVPALNLPFHRSVIVHHLKPDFLPPLARFRGVQSKPGAVCQTPHASKPSGTIGSFLRIIYLLCDYTLGYWFRIRIKLAKLPIGLWIFDRYAYDMLIDSRRFRIKLPPWIIKPFLFLVPRPDLILCLGGDPDKIYDRKPETSLEEVKRQVAALKAFCDGNNRALWIDTTKSIEESANAALTAILDHMARRVK